MNDPFGLVKDLEPTIAPPSELQFDRQRRALLEAMTSAEHGGGTSTHRRRARPWVLAGLAAALLAVALLAVAGMPTAARHPEAVRHGGSGAAAELRLIATNVADRAVPSLQSDQLLFTENQVSLLAQVMKVASTAPAAQATLDLDIKKWSNATGQSCTSITAAPARFASPADEAAWSELGLRNSPLSQPVTGCASGGLGSSEPDAITGDASALDVSQLPLAPAVLAHELETGTTGIPALDERVPDVIQNIAFERAAVILIGPTTGASPAFDAALYQALALIPGVENLGEVTTHSGATGQGFADDSSNGQSTIVVDAQTGALLEARGIEDSGSVATLAPLYVGASGMPSAIGGYDATIQWLDPVGTPSVVGIDALPSDVPLDIFATAEPSATSSQLLALQSRLEQEFGNPEARSYVAAGAEGGGSVSIMQWEFAGSTPQFDDYLHAVGASGLFSSVDVI